MGLRALLVLLLLAGGLGAVLYFTDQKPETKKLSETAVLEGRTLSDSLRFRWQWLNRPPIEIARGADGRYRMAEPVADLASVARLKDIATSWDLAQMRKAPLALDDAGRAKAGLQSPELVFTAEWSDGVKSEVQVGAPGPLGDTRFLAVHGAVWEGPGSLLECLKVGVDDMRERSVFANAFTGANEVRVDMAMPGDRREVFHLKTKDGGWSLLAPIEGRADTVGATQFVTQVLSLRVDNFPSGVLRPPERVADIEVLARGGAGEETVKLWVENGQIFGRLPARGNIGFLSDSLQYAQIFENAPARLRARILVPMGDSAFENLVEAVVDPGQGRGERMHLQRTSPTADWRLHEPVEFATEPTPCQELAEAVQGLVAREFVDATDGKRPRAEDPRYGLVPQSRLSVSLRAAADQKATTLWFGAEFARGVETFVYCCRADEPDTVVAVQKGHVDTLRRSWLVYGQRRVVKQTAGIDRIDLYQGQNTTAVRTFQIEAGKWTQVGAPGNRDEVGNVVQEDLCDLRGDRLVDARPLGAASWAVQLMRKGGDQLDLIRVWDRGQDQLLLVQSGEPGPVAFELNKRLSSDLRAFWK
ncbi:MAG: DUF4340 domain-containing protein [Planctomycetes bacterium]|nr:DUF4340 domain-containing protein [Planctomycetota bacterium]